jgi:hypothetical protein
MKGGRSPIESPSKKQAARSERRGKRQAEALPARLAGALEVSAGVRSTTAKRAAEPQEIALSRIRCP